MIITILLIAFSVCAIFFSAYLKFGVEEFGDLSEMLFQINDFSMEVYGMTATGLCVYFIFALVVGSLSSIFTVYAAISLGQLFHRHKVLGSILSYIGIYFIMQIVTMITMIPYWVKMFSFDYLNDTSMGSYMKYQLFATIIESGIIAIVCYFITEMMMKKKLNLD